VLKQVWELGGGGVDRRVRVCECAHTSQTGGAMCSQGDAAAHACCIGLIMIANPVLRAPRSTHSTLCTAEAAQAGPLLAVTRALANSHTEDAGAEGSFRDPAMRS
jgi:hypothetical protein